MRLAELRLGTITCNTITGELSIHGWSFNRQVVCGGWWVGLSDGMVRVLVESAKLWHAPYLHMSDVRFNS